MGRGPQLIHEKWMTMTISMKTHGDLIPHFGETTICSKWKYYPINGGIIQGNHHLPAFIAIEWNITIYVNL